MILSKLVTGLALAILMSSAHPHGAARAQHGGLVAVANDLSFELVAQGERTALYLFDHDKPLDARAWSGKLTVLAGTQKTEAELKHAGGNRLEASVAVGKGAKVVATLIVRDGKPVSVRFAMK